MPEQPDPAHAVSAPPVAAPLVAAAAPPAGGNRLSRAGMDAFLVALAETGMVREAVRRSGVPRASLYRKRARDARFAAAWAAALDAGLDQLRDEAVRRALTGEERPVWWRGAAVGAVRQYSDALLMFLLRAHQPRIYREPKPADHAAAARADRAQQAALAEAFKAGGDAAIGELLGSIDGKTRGILRGTEDWDETENDEEEGNGPAADGGRA